MSARTYDGVRATALEMLADLDVDEAETLADRVAIVAMMRDSDPERYRAIMAAVLDEQRKELQGMLDSTTHMADQLREVVLADPDLSEDLAAKGRELLDDITDHRAVVERMIREE